MHLGCVDLGTGSRNSGLVFESRVAVGVVGANGPCGPLAWPVLALAFRLASGVTRVGFGDCFQALGGLVCSGPLGTRGPCGPPCLARVGPSLSGLLPGVPRLDFVLFPGLWRPGVAPALFWWWRGVPGPNRRQPHRSLEPGPRACRHSQVRRNLACNGYAGGARLAVASRSRPWRSCLAPLSDS